MLIAYLDWAFPRRYDNGDRGIIYSHLFQNRFRRQKARPMFTLVVHDPPDDWVTLEVSRSKRYGEEHRQDLWRIKGLFKFNYHLREPGETPVLHANSITDPGTQATAVFLNCSNRREPDRDLRFTISIEKVLEDRKEAFVFVDNIPFGIHRPNGKRETRFSNKLVGIAPFGTRLTRVHYSKANGKPMTITRYLINSETGKLTELSSRWEHSDGE